MVSFFCGEGLGGLEFGDGFGVEDEVFVIERLLEEEAFCGGEADGGVFDLFCAFPCIEVDGAWRGAFFSGQEGFLLVGPEAVHGAAEEIEQLCLENEADEHREDECDDDAGDEAAQILEMPDEGFFVPRLDFFPDIEKFFKEEHGRSGAATVAGCAGEVAWQSENRVDRCLGWRVFTLFVGCRSFILRA